MNDGLARAILGTMSTPTSGIVLPAWLAPLGKLVVFLLFAVLYLSGLSVIWVEAIHLHLSSGFSLTDAGLVTVFSWLAVSPLVWLARR